MKKCTGLLIGALLLWMTGCGGGAVPETVAPTEPTIVEIPLETAADARPYLGVELNFQSDWSETDPEAAVLMQAAEEFEVRTGAAVHILWDSGEAVTAESDADIFQTPAESLPQHLSYTLDLTALAAETEYGEHSFEVLRRQVTDSCGILAGIPQVPHLEGLYYDRDAFESCGITQLPSDWTEFLLLCEQLQSASCQPLTMNSGDAAAMLELHLTRSLGAERLKRLERDGGWQEDEAAVNALQQIADFANLGYVVTGGRNKVALSNAVMAVGTNEMCAEIESAARMDLRWGVMPWPGAGTGGCRASSDVLAVHTSCDNPQAAFDFIMLLTTGEFDQLRADITGGIPADPGNASLIAGAAETLQSAEVRRAVMRPENGGLILELWSGAYSEGAIFAAALDEQNG